MAYSKEHLRNIFQNKFDRAAWKLLLSIFFGANKVRRENELFTDLDEPEVGYYMGLIDTSDAFRIGLFYYKINSGSVAHKKIGLRNLVKKFINQNWGEFDAAIVVFDDNQDWRLSFVCDIKEEATAPKRFTFVFGESDNFYRTAIDRFDILQRQEPTFENIRKAFSVDALSDDFFDEYRELYADFVQYITGKRYVKESNKWVERVICEPNYQYATTFDGEDKLVRDYIKKMFGRIVFLYFLQRKGWLDGNRQYMHDLFYNSDKKDNFLDGILEPLFFEILNTDKPYRTDAANALPGSENIPYLNGGLFASDEIDALDCVFPEDLFKRLFDFLDSYNFTIDENDTDDAEIGIDPEMLGRIFENLLEDNKDKGAFYTPKEIVDYMCRESIIAYLLNGLPERSHDLIRRFVETFDASELNDDQRLYIRKKLQAVKICDPAIGSGAFPMGLVNLLSKLYIAMKADTDTAKMKRHIMEQNIYGVDIERGAVNIARLRFWLAMIVEEKEPIPLPNLHFKIMQGNSLLENYNGVDLSDLTKLSTKLKYGESRGLWDTEDSEREDLISSLKSYYKTSDHTKRDRLFNDIINNVRRQLLDKGITLPSGEDPSANTDFFLWHTWFADVFENGGFDIVIGNPPYVEVLNSDTYISYTTYPCYELYAHFFEQGIKLLKTNGILAFITASLYIKGMKFESLRNFLKSSTTLISFRNEGDNVFEEVGMPTSTILILNNIGISRWPFDGSPFIARISSQFKQLGSICNVQRGLEIGKKALDLNGEIPILTGTNVKKFIPKTPSYISRTVYVENAKDESYYKGERLVIRETGSELTVTYLDEPICVNRSLYTFLRHKDAPSIKFLVGCLNSKLLQYFYTEKFKAPTELFPKIRIGQAKQLPIAMPSNQEDKAISDLVTKVIIAKKDGRDATFLLEEINFLVYKLYGLSYPEILIVDPETTITEEEYYSHGQFNW